MPKVMLVLAGGFGTRLQSVVSDVPKPLAPISGKPFLEYLIRSWIAQGIQEFIFLLHHKANLITDFLNVQFQQDYAQHCKSQTIIENKPLGTGGAIANAVNHFNLRDDFLVANADTWLGNGVQQVANTSCLSMGVIEVDNVARYGGVTISGDQIVNFNEKGTSNKSGWINAGIYHLSSELFSSWQGSAFSLEADLFPQLAQQGDLKAVKLFTEFIDIGIPEDYERFSNWLISDKREKL